ncbi:unnamed protein product [marine sediment metagenome]|uniref:C2H2-type domain-containing protein n=1 Tax=marine sediment metagenome TaxID=412755 RepID=X1S1S5_9ZZZZ
MIKCQLCDRQFKNGAGLAGHMRLSHPSAQPVEGDKLETRLAAVETALLGLAKQMAELLPEPAIWHLLHLANQHNIELTPEALARLPAVVREGYLKTQGGALSKHSEHSVNKLRR